MYQPETEKAKYAETVLDVFAGEEVVK